MTHWDRGWPIFAAVIFLVGALASGPAHAQAPIEVRIGVTLPLTGPAAEAGVAMRQAMKMAEEEVNARGGVKLGGQRAPLKVLFEDNQSRPEVGVSGGEKLITRDKIHYLISDAFHSSVTMATMELAPKYNIPVVSAQPVSEEIVKKILANKKRYRYFWKMDFGSTAYANAVFGTVGWLIKKDQLAAKNKTIAFVVEDTDYGRSNAERARDLFQEIGWRAVAMETVPIGHTDFYPQLGKIRAQKADVLMTVFTALSSGVAFVKQFNELGLKALHMAIYYPIRPEFIPQAGKDSEGVLWAPLAFDPAVVEHQKEFGRKIRAKFNAVPNSDHGYGYDAIYNAVDSIERAGSVAPAKVIEAVAKLDRKGIVGRFQFDQRLQQGKDGPDFIPVPTAQIQGGKNVIVFPEAMAAAKYVPQPWTK
ncbi:MAG: ABC transporter substrate-binding protein [Candidatus Methylomirabilia bacterium]